MLKHFILHYYYYYYFFFRERETIVPVLKKSILIGHAVNIIILSTARQIQCRSGIKRIWESYP